MTGEPAVENSDLDQDIEIEPEPVQPSLPPEPQEPVGSEEEALRVVEAILFASHDALPLRVFCRQLVWEEERVTPLLKQLKETYASRGVNLEERGGKWCLRTAPDLAERLVVERAHSRKLSRAALETLAIIAYHQPLTRAEIEEIRGVALSKGTLDVLMEAGWIRPKGRRQTPGRPVTWGTSDGFLDHFGLESVKDLPGVQELKAAGLIDSRPAILAYSTRAAQSDSTLFDIDQEDDDDALEPLLGDDEADQAP